MVEHFFLFKYKLFLITIIKLKQNTVTSMRIESILLISIILNICLCEDSSKQVQMVNLKFSQ